MNKIIINKNSNNYKSKIIDILNYIFQINNSKKTENIFIIEKKNEGKELSKLMQDYFDKPKILEEDKKFLTLYIKEFIEYIKKKIIFLYLFLIPTYNLITSYINSDIDEEDEQNNNIYNNIYNDNQNNINIINENNIFNYNQIFLLLKQNSFISKEIIIKIYSYFSNIYNDINSNNNNNY